MASGVRALEISSGVPLCNNIWCCSDGSDSTTPLRCQISISSNRLLSAAQEFCHSSMR